MNSDMFSNTCFLHGSFKHMLHASLVKVLPSFRAFVSVVAQLHLSPHNLKETHRFRMSNVRHL